MSRKSVSIEVNADQAYEIIVNELLYERSLLKKPKYRIEDKKENLAAIETVLDYFSSDWRETTKS